MRPSCAAVGVWMLLVASQALAQPATSSRLHWVTNGTVGAAAVHGQTLFIGGSFTRVAPAENLLGPWFGVSTATGAPLPPLPLADGPVQAIEPDGAGGYFVGGGFTRIGGVARPALAHVLADGSVDPQFNPPLLPPPGGAPVDVRSLARSNDVLYVGGALTIGGSPRGSGLGALEVGSGAARPWHPDLLLIAEKIIVTGARVFVVGQGAVVASLDPTTAAVQWSQGLGSGWLNDAALAGGRLIVVGPFAGFGTGTDIPQGVASLDPVTGAIDPEWGPAWPFPPAFPQLRAVSVVGSVVYVGGGFDTFAGQPRANAAALDLETGTLTPWAPQADGAVMDIVPAGDAALYLAGAFRRVGGEPRDGLARVNDAGAPDTWRAGAFSTHVHTLHHAGEVLLAGGLSAVSGGVARENLAAFALDTDDVRPWAPVMPHAVNELATDGERVFAGLAHAYPVALPPGQPSVAAFDALTGLPTPWSPPAGGPWNLVGLVDGFVYLYASGFGSQFVRVDAQSATVDPAWQISAGWTTPTLYPVGNRLYLAGDRFAASGVSRSYLAAADRETGQLTAWTQRALVPPPEGLRTVGGVAITGQTMYLDSSTPFGTELLGIDIDTGHRVTSVLPPEVHGSTVRAVADGWLIVTRLGPAGARVEVGAVRGDGVASSWNPGLVQADGPVGSGPVPVRVLATDTDVIITNVKGGSGAPVYGVAVLPRQRSSFPSALDAETTANAVRLTWTGTEPPSTSYIVEAGSEPGRSNLAVVRTGSGATSLDTLAPAGTYFVRVRADTPGVPAPASNPIAVTVAGCAGAVPPPTRLAAALDGTAVTLTWQPSAAVVLGYAIEAGTRQGSANLARLVVPGNQTTLATMAPPGTYFVRVRADTTCGPSAATADLWFTVGEGSLPPAPAGLTVTGTAPVYTATWQPVTGASYMLEVGSAPGLSDVARVTTTGTFVGPAAVARGRTYYLRVRAIGAAGMGPPGEEVVLIVP